MRITGHAHVIRCTIKETRKMLQRVALSEEPTTVEALALAVESRLVLIEAEARVIQLLSTERTRL